MYLNEDDLRLIIRQILIKEGIGRKVMDMFGSMSSRSSNKSTNATGLDANAEIKGKTFTVHGVTFQSVSATGAGTNAENLYNSAVSSGMTKSGKGWETTQAGKDWISANIYDASKAGSGATYAPKLGTKNESYWSSWFFSVCYKPYEGGRGSNHFDYGADEGIKRREEVLANPESFIGKELFLTFGVDEAPVFQGDAVFAHRDGGSSGFSGIVAGAPSHMRILGDDAGTVYGGNESNKVGKGKVKLDDKRRVSGKYSGHKYVAVYKRVKVLEAGTTDGTMDNNDDSSDPSFIKMLKSSELSSMGGDKYTVKIGSKIHAYWVKDGKVQTRNPKDRKKKIPASEEVSKIILSKIK